MTLSLPSAQMDAFALELLRAPSAAEAYRRTYNVSPTTSPASVAVAASRLRRHPFVRQRYEQFLAARVFPLPETNDQALAAIDVIRQHFDINEGRAEAARLMNEAIELENT